MLTTCQWNLAEIRRNLPEFEEISKKMLKMCKIRNVPTMFVGRLPKRIPSATCPAFANNVRVTTLSDINSSSDPTGLGRNPLHEVCVVRINGAELRFNLGGGADFEIYRFV